MTAGKITTYQTGAAHYYHAPLSGDGYLSLDASGAVVAPSRTNKGKIVDGTTFIDGAIDHTAVKTGTGEYTITLSGSFPRVRSVVPAMTFDATPAALWAVIVGPTVNSDTGHDEQEIKVVLVNSSGAPTNPSAPCGVFLKFTLENR